METLASLRLEEVTRRPKPLNPKPLYPKPLNPKPLKPKP